ncbi:MAG: hypothetical protein ACI84C_002868 [Flavobacteriales bacterium]|jgi:hypothetical protein
MKALIIISSLLFGLVLSVQGQKKYTLIHEDHGVQFLTKIGTAKRSDGGSETALFLKVVNNNSEDYTYSFGLDFYFKNKTTDSMPLMTYCLRAGRSSQGKMNGVYFQSDSLTDEQIKSDDFGFELIDLEVSPGYTCD